MEVASRPPALGFIAIDVHFTRPSGDALNGNTWPFPLIRVQAEHSSVKQVVTNHTYDDAFIDRFVQAGLKLAAKGCVGIITSCGFLAMAQPEYVAAWPVSVPLCAAIPMSIMSGIVNGQ